MNIFNFSAGPASLPKEVLLKAQAELIDWNGQGTSVMEVSHRGKPFIELAEKSEADLRRIMSIPDNYKVLFLQGGGRGQFFSVPLNLYKRGKRSQHLVSGQWSKGAVVEAQKYMACDVIGENFTVANLINVTRPEASQIDSSAAYFHYCTNETVDGIEINWLPETGDVPLVADMSSNILSKQLDVSKFGIIYAGAQKNIGPSGLALVIIRDDLLDFARDDTPSTFHYATQAKKDSMYNTPPTFSWYLASLVFDWIEEKGGLAQIEKINQEKAKRLYSFINNSDFYSNRIAPQYQSKMNVTFYLADEALNQAFLTQSNDAGLHALKGHRDVGGMRASIYNAMPLEGVDALIEFMSEFERVNG